MNINLIIKSIYKLLKDKYNLIIYYIYTYILTMDWITSI